MSAQNWRPIETAPKDGTTIIAANHDVWQFFTHYQQDAHGEWHWGINFKETNTEPTHWMPLPVPPPKL